MRSLAARATLVGEARSIPTEVVDPTTTGTLLRSFAGRGTPIVIYTERDDPSRQIVGTVDDVVDKSLHLRALDLPNGRRTVPVEVSFDMVTRVDFGGRYLTGLARAIGVS